MQRLRNRLAPDLKVYEKWLSLAYFEQVTHTNLSFSNNKIIFHGYRHFYSSFVYSFAP